MDNELKSNSVFVTDAVVKLMLEDALLSQQINPDANQIRVKLLEAINFKAKGSGGTFEHQLNIQRSNRAFFEAMELLSSMIKRRKKKILFCKLIVATNVMVPTACYVKTLNRLTGMLLSHTSNRECERYYEPEGESTFRFIHDHNGLFFPEQHYLDREISEFKDLRGLSEYKRRVFVLLLGWLPLALRTRLGVR